MKRILATASFLTILTAAAPAMAHPDPSVLCSIKANYQGSGAAYTPGADVHGKAVAPADINAAPMAMPASIRIPMTMDLAQRMNEVLPAGTKLETNAMGMIEIRNDGHVVYNGKDLTQPATSMCATMDKQKEAAMKTASGPKVVHRKHVAKAAPVAPVTENHMEEAPVPEATPAPEVTSTPVPPPENQSAVPAPAPAANDSDMPNLTEPAPSAATPPSATTLAPAPAVPPPTPPAMPPSATPAPAPEIQATPPQGEILAPSATTQAPRPPAPTPTENTVQPPVPAPEETGKTAPSDHKPIPTPGQ